MPNSELINFYGNIFNVEVTVFGIISAVILVFVQLVYSNYSYKYIKEILKNKFIVLFFVFSVIDIAATSFANYFLSVEDHNLVPNFYFSADRIVSNSFYAFFCLIMIFISISFFVILIVKNISYLQPKRALLFLSKNTNFNTIRNFIWKKYGLEPPYNLKFRVKFINFTISKKKTKKEEEAEKEEERKNDEKLQKIEEQIEVIKNKVENSEDPFLPLRDITIQFVKKSEIGSFSESIALWETMSIKFAEKTQDIDIKNKDVEWSPENGLLLNFTKHILDEISPVIEICDKENFESGIKTVIQFLYKYSLILLKQKSFDSLEKILIFWKPLSDKYIKKFPSVFREIVKACEGLADFIYDSIDEKKLSLEEGEDKTLTKIYETLGQMGEVFLSTIPIKKSSRFMNYDYSSEYDDFMNALLSMGGSIEKLLPESYPLMFFYTIQVIGEKIAQIYTKNKVNKLSENIFDIAYIYSTFSRSAIKKGNSNGAALACSDLVEFYKNIKKMKLNNEANEIIKLLVDVGMDVAGNKDKLKPVEFIRKPLDEWIIEELAMSGEDLGREVIESYIKSPHGDRKSVQEFITELSNRTGSDYGLGF